jgi:hypothetical protein
VALRPEELVVRVFEDTEGERKNVPISIGIQGPPGGGKTFSALLIAQGAQAVRGGDIYVVDTENRRALKYAGLDPGIEGVKPFKFRHIDFRPPFRPQQFGMALDQFDKKNPAAIIVDSASDEHEGPGGYLRWHDEPDNKKRAGSNEWSAWNDPSEGRKAFIQAFTHNVLAPVIFTFRARQKTEQVETANGKKVVNQLGWQPVAGTEVLHNIDLLVLLPPRADGIPRWRPDRAHEEFIIKLPRQFRELFREGQPITPAIGAALATWARGGDLPKPSASAVDLAGEPKLFAFAREKAALGSDAFMEWQAKLSVRQVAGLNEIRDQLNAIMDAADARLAAKPSIESSAPWREEPPPHDDSWADQEAERRHQARTTPANQETLEL